MKGLPPLAPRFSRPGSGSERVLFHPGARRTLFPPALAEES
jgi:hypothetical protein